MTSPEKKKVNELRQDSLAKKLLLTSLSAWLVNKDVDVKIRGSQNEIRVISNALAASNRLREDLNRPDVTVNSIVENLRSKDLAAAEFEKVFGMPWPL
jgi:hypothetical protein